MILVAAGNQAYFPNVASDMSIDGIISDQIEAATIMPPANPKSSELTFCEMSLLKKKTNDEPNVVIKNIMANPIIVTNVLFISDYFAKLSITMVKLLANNFTANANRMTPKNFLKIKMMSLPSHFSILPTKRMTIYANVKFKIKPNMMLITE